MPILPPTSVVLYGAYGHTGRFIIGELLAAGFRPVLSGRDEAKLRALSTTHPELEIRAAALEDPRGLDRALEGGAAGVALVPATGFYGGLGDLLATAAMGDWQQSDEITLAYALSSWRPTAGTRATIAAGGARRGGQRLVYAGGRLELRGGAAPVTEWAFPPPFGKQAVVAEFTTADSVTMPRHLRMGAISEYMTVAPLGDLSHPELSPPAPVDAQGRSEQEFLVEAVVRFGAELRLARARGRDIYAVSAPLVVEALERVLRDPGKWRGVVTAAELGDPRSFLAALAPHHLEWELSTNRPPRETER